MTSTTEIQSSSHSAVVRFVTAIPFGIGLLLQSTFVGADARARVLRGSAWTVVGFGSGQLLRLGSNIILTRLLFPEDFGLMALVNVFLLGLEMLSDFGVNASIIQNRRGAEESFLCTAWTLQIIRGVVLWICSCVIAWPAAWFYEEPQLRFMIPVAGIAVLILGFQTTAIPMHNRQLQLARITLFQLLTQIANLFVTISLAWQLHSVWALVWGNVSGAVVQVALAHWMLPGIKHRVAIDRSSAGEIVRFGKWLFFATALGYLAGHASDKLVLGKLTDTGALGIYTIAFMLSQMPAAIMDILMLRVLYPNLAKCERDDQGNFRQTLVENRQLLLPSFMLLVCSLGFLSPLLFETLWQSRYHSAGWMTQALLIGVWFSGLNSSLNTALLAKGDSYASATQNAIVVSVGIPCMYFGCVYWGTFGLIVGIVISKILAHIVLHTMLSRLGISIWRADLHSHLTMIVAALCVAMSCGHWPVFSAVGRVADGDVPALIIATAVMGTLIATCSRLWANERRTLITS